jgi:predicted membrane metal-binding protein
MDGAALWLLAAGFALIFGGGAAIVFLLWDDPF